MRTDIIKRLIRCLTFVAAGLSGGDMRLLADELVDIPETRLEAVLMDGEAGADPEKRMIAVLRRLAGERGERAGQGLRLLLERLDRFERTALVAEWAVDPDPRIRMAVAQVLEGGLQVVSGPLALTHIRARRG